MDQHSQTDGPVQDRYQYWDLDDDDIRRVRLLPSAQGHHGFLTVNNRLSGGYSALSYAWGPVHPHMDERIWITDDYGGKGPLSIVANLRDAITDLKSCPLQSSIFFIDQICIDQQNNAEKSVQVAEMKDVYRCADQVVVYLGPAQDGESEALELLKSLDDRYGDWFDSLRPLNLLNACLDGCHSVRGGPRPPQLSPAEITVLDLLFVAFYGSGWTRRLWMCQEVLMNKTILFLKGSKLVSARSVFVLLLSFTDIRMRNVSGVGHPPDITLDVEDLASTHTSALSMICARRKRYVAEDEYTTLLETIIEHSIYLACSDHKDKIYAVLGLAVDDLGVTPDYDADVADVFTDFAQRCIEEGGDLAVLQHVFQLTDEAEEPPHLSNMSSWPTWVPSFEDATTYRFQHHASGSILPITEFDTAQRALNIKGYQIAEIETIAGIVDDGIGRESMSVSLATARQFIATIAQARDALSRKGIHDIDARLCYGMVDTAEELANLPPDFVPARALQNLMDTMVWALNTTDESGETLGYLPLDFDQDLDGQSGREMVLRFPTSAFALCITTTGEIILATTGAQVGDLVTFLLGGSEVYVLRSVTDNKFNMIGPAFMRGYMDGEELTDPSWEHELLQILLTMLSEEMPPSFSGLDTYPFERVRKLVGLLQLLEHLKTAEKDLSAGISAELVRRADQFCSSDADRQAEVLHRGIVGGLYTNSSGLQTMWRKQWWEMIQSWAEQGFIRPPGWITKARTYTIV